MVEKAQKKSGFQGVAPKGGARFPRHRLGDAVEWARKLVSKTHIAPQPAEIIYASVVNSKGPRGEMKVSSLKQFGLLEGSSTAYAAADLAKTIAIAPDDELPALYAKAALSPTIFKALFDTFHGDVTPFGKLRQRAAELNVHPDNLATCVANYVASLELARLVSVDGENVSHVQATADGGDFKESATLAETLDGTDGASDSIKQEAPASVEEKLPVESHGPRAVFQVNVNLDASLDTEKLEKQLALLKRFGAI